MLSTELLKCIEVFDESSTGDIPICFDARGETARWICVDSDARYVAFQAFNQCGCRSAKGIKYTMASAHPKAVEEKSAHEQGNGGKGSDKGKDKGDDKGKDKGNGKEQN